MSKSTELAGSSELERDLKLVLELGSSIDFPKIKAAATDLQLDLELMKEIVPAELISIAWFMQQEESFEAAVRSASPEGVKLLEQTKAFIEKEFPEFSHHPIFEELEGIAEGVQRSRAPKLPPFKFNAVTSVASMPLWNQASEQAISPIVRLGMKGLDNKILLDSTIDWDDLSFLCNTIVRVLRDEFKRVLPFSKMVEVQIVEKDAIAERLAAIKQLIAETEALGLELGIRAVEDAKSVG